MYDELKQEIAILVEILPEERNLVTEGMEIGYNNVLAIIRRLESLANHESFK